MNFTLLASLFTFAFASPSLLDVPVKTIDGTSTTLKPYLGKVLLVVNTASQCGYTHQYAGLEKLYEKYKAQGFEVLGFPSNDFGGQEPGSNKDIKLFCSGKYHVSFPLFEKNPVSGEKKQPLYAQLIAESNDHSEIEWNFEKFLLDRQGHVVARFRSKVEPDAQELVNAIEAHLRKDLKLTPNHAQK